MTMTKLRVSLWILHMTGLLDDAHKEAYMHLVKSLVVIKCNYTKMGTTDRYIESMSAWADCYLICERLRMHKHPFLFSLYSIRHNMCIWWWQS